MQRLKWLAPLPFLVGNTAFAQNLALALTDSLSWVNSEKKEVIAEVIYADEVVEQRVGTLVDGKYLVSDADTFHGQWHEAESKFVTKEYANTNREIEINKRESMAFTPPTENAWAVGLGYRGFKRPNNSAVNSSDDVSHQLTVNSQYQLVPQTQGKASERLIVQKELGYSQVYWQSHELLTSEPETEDECCQSESLFKGASRPDQMRQFRIGQLFLQPKDKAARELFGFQKSRNLKPADNFLFFQGQLYTPAQISVLVNEQLRYSNVVNPGQIDLYNVPLDAGVNNVRVLVRQLDGSLREFSSTLNTQAMLLPQGQSISDYSGGYNPDTRKLEAHGSYGTALSEDHTVKGALSLDQQAQLQLETAHSVPWGIVYTKGRKNENSNFNRFEVGTRGANYSVSADHTPLGWATSVTGRYDRLSVNLKKAVSDEFALAQISWTQTAFNKAITSASCSFLRSNSGSIQRYCGVSLNFLMLDNLPTSLSVTRSTGVQKGLTLQGALPGIDSNVNFLSSPSLDSISGRFPLGPFEGYASTDSLGGTALSLDATIGGQGAAILGYGKRTNTESATMVADVFQSGPKVFYNSKPLPAGLAADVPLDVRHRLSLDPESVPMDVDLESFTIEEKPRLPGVYIMKFQEAVIGND
ncbi:MAG: hypothetical protein R3194_02900 [Limnobacter sp.]|nr:hypothetical protein [Limnobacter sp.]